MIFQRVIGFLLTAGLLTGSLVCYGQQNKRYKAEKGKQSQSKPVQSESGQTVTDDYQLKWTPQGENELRELLPPDAGEFLGGAGIDKGSGNAKPKGGSGSSKKDSPVQLPKSEVDPLAPFAGTHKGCQYYGPLACNQCLAFWGTTGEDRNNHFCKDKSRSAGTKGWDCFNYAEDTSHGYECISYCPPETPTCKDHCDQKLADGSPNHRHPLRRTQNRNSHRILGPPGSAPKKNMGLESRDQCNW